MIARIKKNDNVEIISGKDKGLQGAVLHVDSKKQQVLVKGGAVVVKHVKPRRKGESGSIKKEESFIHISRVMPVCPGCKKPCRVNSKIQDSKNMRICNYCKETF